MMITLKTRIILNRHSHSMNDELLYHGDYSYKMTCRHMLCNH